MRTIPKGFAFSMDVLLASLLIFVMLFLITHSFNARNAHSLGNIENFSLQKNALFLLDSMLKNRNAENALIGAALFDAEKHRVKSNEIDYEKLKSAAQIESDEFFVHDILLEWYNGMEERIFSDSGEAVNCIGVERVALVEGKKALVRLVLCEK